MDAKLKIGTTCVGANGIFREGHGFGNVLFGSAITKITDDLGFTIGEAIARASSIRRAATSRPSPSRAIGGFRPERMSCISGERCGSMIVTAKMINKKKRGMAFSNPSLPSSAPMVRTSH